MTIYGLGGFMNLFKSKPKFFDDTFPEWNPGALVTAASSKRQETHIPISVFEIGNTYEVQADLPGVKQEDIDVRINDRVVTIQAVKREWLHDTSIVVHVLRNERSVGPLRSSFVLPSTVDVNACKATFEQGVLCLILPIANNQYGLKKITIT